MQNSESINSEKSGYDPVYYSSLFAVEDRHFWFRSRNALIKMVIESTTKNLPQRIRVLEIGCGTGNVLKVLESSYGLNYTYGLDLFREGLLLAKKRVCCSLIQADMDSPPFRNVFHIVGLFDVLEHFIDDEKILCGMKKLLAENGRVIISVPAYLSLWSYFDEAGKHFRRYSIKQLNKKISDSGFQVEFTSYYMATIFPFLWFWRKLSNMFIKKYDNKHSQYHYLSLRELKVYPVLNGILRLLLWCENQLITRFKLKLPFGSSIIAVIKK